MLARTFLLFITFNTISTYNCFSMELESKNNCDKEITHLNNGLLSEISGIITTTGEIKSIWGNKKFTESFTHDDTVINLWSYNVESTNQGWEKRFTPLIIKVTTHKLPHCIESLGPLLNQDAKTKKKHCEAKEAIRSNKALYWSYKQGVVIYSLTQQPHPSIIKLVKELLDKNETYLEIIVQPVQQYASMIKGWSSQNSETNSCTYRTKTDPNIIKPATRPNNT